MQTFWKIATWIVIGTTLFVSGIAAKVVLSDKPKAVQDTQPADTAPVKQDRRTAKLEANVADLAKANEELKAQIAKAMAQQAIPPAPTPVPAPKDPTTAQMRMQSMKALEKESSALELPSEGIWAYTGMGASEHEKRMACQAFYSDELEAKRNQAASNERIEGKRIAWAMDAKKLDLEAKKADEEKLKLAEENDALKKYRVDAEKALAYDENQLKLGGKENSELQARAAELNKIVASLNVQVAQKDSAIAALSAKQKALQLPPHPIVALPIQPSTAPASSCPGGNCNLYSRSRSVIRGW